MELSFFRADGDVLVPLTLARSLWSPHQMHGVAVSGALARAAERQLEELGHDHLRPARFTVDLFRPATMDPCTFTTSVVREGPRICLVDVTLLQDGRPVARAGAVFLKPTESASGEVWSPSERPCPPPLALAPVTAEPHVPFIRSDADWSQDFGGHQNSDRKQTWQTGVPVVLGEPATPFQAAAGVADATSMITNWGTKGIEYINTDITLTLARLPTGTQIGLLAADRVEQDGIAVCTATVFDRSGPLGTAVVTALANARRQVDLSGVEYSDDGRRRTSPGV